MSELSEVVIWSVFGIAASEVIGVLYMSQPAILQVTKS
jgi:hypothetical protein